MGQLGAVDYVVFVSVLVISTAIGIFYALRERMTHKSTTSAYLMGDRHMPLIPVALSLLVSYMSGILILGASSEMYTRGTMFWWATVGCALSALVTCFIFVPIFYNMQLTSVYEYLELRFRSRLVRQIGSFFYILVTILYLAIAIYAPSVALHAVSNLPLWFLIIASGAVCTFYVTIGGIKAVVWTDAVQAVFMLAGTLGILIEGLILVGGLERTWTVSKEHGRINMFESSMDPFAYMTVYGAVFGQLFSWLGWYGINQSSVQRFCGMSTMRQGQWAVLLNIPGIMIVKTLICLCGLVMFVYYIDCDPLAAKIVTARDQILPHFVLEAMTNLPGLPGLFVACLYSGTLSTVSSGLNSMAAVVWEDFIKFSDRVATLSQAKATLITKFLALGFGILSTAISFLAPHLGGVLKGALTTMGAVNGPLTGLFLLGVLVPWANKHGAIVGATVSFAFSVWICIGAHITDPHRGFLQSNVSGCTNLSIANFSVNSTFGSDFQSTHSEGLHKLYGLSSVLYDMIGIFLVFLVAIPVSVLTGIEKYQTLDHRLFCPFVLRFIGEKPHSFSRTNIEEKELMPVNKKQEERHTLLNNERAPLSKTE